MDVKRSSAGVVDAISAEDGKCNYENWHGHNYKIEVTVAGMPNPDTGYVMDLTVLKGLMKKYITEPCDHRNLNMDVEFLKDIMPSTENLAIAFWHQIVDKMPAGVKLHRINLQETERNSVEYFGE